MSTSPVKNLACTALLLSALFATARVVHAEVSYETRFASAGVKVNECQRMADESTNDDDKRQWLRFGAGLDWPTSDQ